MRLYKFGSGGGARAPSTLPLTYPLPLLSSIEEGAKSNSSCNLMERAEAEGGAPRGRPPPPPPPGGGCVGPRIASGGRLEGVRWMEAAICGMWRG
jgi:hypothetical protein